MNFDLSKLQRTKKINNNEYTIKLLGGLEGIRVGNKLIKAVLPIVGGGLDGMKKDDIFDTPKTWTHIALTVCEQLDELNAEELILTLLKGATIKYPDQPTKDLDINSDFMANYGELIVLLEFTLKENFGSLFTEKGIIQSLTQAIDKLTNS